jgi:hypothetical protein
MQSRRAGETFYVKQNIKKHGDDVSNVIRKTQISILLQQEQHDWVLYKTLIGCKHTFAAAI